LNATVLFILSPHAEKFIDAHRFIGVCAPMPTRPAEPVIVRIDALATTTAKGGSVPLFALSSLMPCSGQQFAVFMFTHLFTSFFNYAAQQITPYRYDIRINVFYYMIAP
jgi:hypothetical protein